MDVKRTSIAWVLALVCSPLFALAPDKNLDQYIHETWDSRQGLPQNSVNGVVQGPRGYLWMATFDGLVRFDGARFVRQPDEGLPGNRLRIVGHDDDGFWIGGQHGGLSRHDGRSAEPFPLADHGIEDSISHVKTGRRGIWIAGHEGLFLVTSDGAVHAFGPEDGLPDSGVWQIALQQHSARLFAGTRHGLAVADLENLESGFEPFDHSGLRDTIVYTLLPEADGGLWAGSQKGLVHIDRDGNARMRLLGSSPSEKLSGRALLRDRQDNLWVGTWNGGLYRINERGIQQLSRNDGLASNRITSLFEDREGNLWFGTDGGGLGRLRDGHATSYGGEAWDMASTSVTTIAEHPVRGLWLGLNCAGIAHFDGGIEQRYAESAGLDNTCVFSLLVDSEARLWAGTYGGGIYRMENGRLRQVPVPPDNAVVLALEQLEDGRIRAGTTQGLLHYDPDSDTFEKIPEAGDDLIQLITEDDGGHLWLATLNGIRHGNRQAGFESIGEQRLGHTRAIHHANNGHVWIGTYGNGLFRYDGENLFRFTREQGLAEPVISRILADEGGHFWMSGNQGIQSVAIDHLNSVVEGRREKVELLRIGMREGMRTVETNGGSQPAGIRAGDGSLWFPTVEGIVHLHPERIQRNPLPPPVEIEKVVIDGKTEPAEGEIIIPPGAGNIEIHYTGLSFSVPERVQFRYRLNEDESWMDAGNRRVAYYSSIPPGEHQFQVIAANSDGIWNEEGSTLELVSQATFQQTAWFPISIAASATGLVAVLFGIWVGNVRRREQHLAAVVRERTRELEVANEQLEGLARIDGLTGIANRRHFEEVLDRKWKQAREDGEPLGIIVIDIDHFKEYNDYHGHLAGDDCLRKVASTIERCLHRKPDFLARYGGEEFVVILPKTNREFARIPAERMVRAVAELKMPYGESEQPEYVTISAGVAAAVPQAGDADPAELLHTADRALYTAKSTGRNVVHIAVP